MIFYAHVNIRVCISRMMPRKLKLVLMVEQMALGKSVAYNGSKMKGGIKVEAIKKNHGEGIRRRNQKMLSCPMHDIYMFMACLEIDMSLYLLFNLWFRFQIKTCANYCHLPVT